jgi:hypothetical protein
MPASVNQIKKIKKKSMDKLREPIHAPPQLLAGDASLPNCRHPPACLWIWSPTAECGARARLRPPATAPPPVEEGISAPATAAAIAHQIRYRGASTAGFVWTRSCSCQIYMEEAPDPW